MTARTAQSAHTIDVIVAASAWTRALPGARAVAKRAAEAALVAARQKRAAEVSVLLTGDAAVHKLNATYRGRLTLWSKKALCASCAAVVHEQLVAALSHAELCVRVDDDG